MMSRNPGSNFFFSSRRRHTRYIGDWSSDVCSSDLTFGWLTFILIALALVGRLPRRAIGATLLVLVLFILQSVFVAVRGSLPAVAALHPRSEERRVGKECMSRRCAHHCEEVWHKSWL